GPSFGHRVVPFAQLVGRVVDSPVLFDPRVSRWDTQVGDLGRLKRGTLSASRVRASDRLSLSLADMVLCDTWEHGDFYSSEFGVTRRKLSRVPVGADHFAFDLGGRRASVPRSGPLDVVYLGGYLPLHRGGGVFPRRGSRLARARRRWCGAGGGDRVARGESRTPRKHGGGGPRRRARAGLALSDRGSSRRGDPTLARSHRAGRTPVI